MGPSEVGLSLFVGSLVMLGLVAILGGFLHYRRERLLTHAERMKALELGRPLSDHSGPGSPTMSSDRESSGDTPFVPEHARLARKCYTTALWVAFWGFLFSAQSGSVSGVSIAIAASAGSVCATLAICGTILATRPNTPVAPEPSYKPQADPDAFDVVGRRG